MSLSDKLCDHLLCAQGLRSSEPLGGLGRAALTSADDYADLMQQTVRDLRYAPIDREYSGQILKR